MANFLIFDGSSVVNAIVADSKEIAESITGMIAYSFDEVPEGVSVGTEFVDGQWVISIAPQSEVVVVNESDEV